VSEGLGSLGPILGDETCKHEVTTFYTGYEGIYAVCHACGGHFWDAKPPEGVEVIDLMAFVDEPPNECSHGIAIDEDCADCERLTARMRAYGLSSRPEWGGAE